MRNDDYWGEPAKLDRLIFRVIPDENARTPGAAGRHDRRLRPPVARRLAGAGGRGLPACSIRPAFNILYLGINQKNNPALRDLRVRQAIAHALDRESLVRNQLPEGAVVATQFMPGHGRAGTTPTSSRSAYDPERAQALLAEAGVPNLTVNFYYPTEVTRPYMPNPTNIFTAHPENLRAGRDHA